jgi:hypothetical protein
MTTHTSDHQQHPSDPTAETSPCGLVPLAALVGEGLAATIDELADRLGEVVVLDDIGRRSCTRETARRLFAADAEAKAEMEALWRRQREKTVQLGREAQASVSRGVPLPAGLEDVTAVQLMGASAAAARLDAAGRRHDEMASGGAYYHPIEEE